MNHQQDASQFGDEAKTSSFPKLLRALLGEDVVAACQNKRGVCGECRGTGATQFCSVCHQVYYCSKECQRAAWKQHKKVCKKEEAQIAELSGLLSPSDDAERPSEEALRLSLTLTGFEPMAAKTLLDLLQSGVTYTIGMPESEMADVLDDLFGPTTTREMRKRRRGGVERRLQELKQALGIEERIQQLREEHERKAQEQDAAMLPIVAECDRIMAELMAIMPQVVMLRHGDSPHRSNADLAQHLLARTKRAGKRGWGEVPEFLRFVTHCCEGLLTQPLPDCPGSIRSELEGRKAGLQAATNRLWVRYSRLFEGDGAALRDDAHFLAAAQVRAHAACALKCKSPHDLAKPGRWVRPATEEEKAAKLAQAQAQAEAGRAGEGVDTARLSDVLELIARLSAVL